DLPGRVVLPAIGDGGQGGRSAAGQRDELLRAGRQRREPAVVLGGFPGQGAGGGRGRGRGRRGPGGGRLRLEVAGGCGPCVPPGGQFHRHHLAHLQRGEQPQERVPVRVLRPEGREPYRDRVHRLERERDPAHAHGHGQAPGAGVVRRERFESA